ncbi:MAG: hypothetical protein ABFC63_01420 [Thermoguttaceae bacterium]
MTPVVHHETLDAATAKARKYWNVIRWNPVAFLTIHDLDGSRIFHDRMQPTFFHDLLRGFRAVAGNMTRALAGVLRPTPRPHTSRSSPTRQPYLLLITVGGPKYASEERAVVEACRAKGVALRVIHMFFDQDPSANDLLLSPFALLHRCDYLGALGRWLGRLVGNARHFVTCDRKQRSLFVAAISSMWQYYLHRAMANRIVADHGAPQAVFSLLPSAAMSRSIVERMKTYGVATYGIRTQTTSRNIEHLAINTDVLFCKSAREKSEYAAVFNQSGPRLEDGCILSLPEPGGQEPLPLPERYALLLGTAPTTEEADGDYDRFNEKLFQAAAAAGLPVVFKSHDLGKELDRAWFDAHPELTHAVSRVEAIDRNRELIDRAALVISAPSTLLYYAMLRDVPVVIVESRPYLGRGYEMETIPTPKVAWRDEVAVGRLDNERLAQLSRAARRWFEDNYYLDKDAGFLVDFMLRHAV